MSEMKLLMENWRNVISEAELKYDEKMYKDMSQFVIDSYAHFVFNYSDKAADLKNMSKLLNKEKLDRNDRFKVEKKIEDVIAEDLKFDLWQFVYLYTSALEDDEFKETFQEMHKLSDGSYRIASSIVPIFGNKIEVNGNIKKVGDKYRLSYYWFIDDNFADTSLDRDYYSRYTDSIEKVGSDEFFKEQFIESEAIAIMLDEIGIMNKINSLFINMNIVDNFNADPNNTRLDPYWSRQANCPIYSDIFLGDKDFVSQNFGDTYHKEYIDKVRLFLIPSEECVTNLPGGQTRSFLGYWKQAKTSAKPNYIILKLDQHLPDILKTLRHELQHETQWLIQHVNLLPHKAGGPVAQWQDYDDEKKWKKTHSLRGIEYKPRLSDEIHKFKDRYMYKIEHWALTRKPKAYIRNAINYEMNNWVRTKKWFQELKKHKPSWYKKAKKEFSTEIIRALDEKLKELS